jgi:hypothetical protein
MDIAPMVNLTHILRPGEEITIKGTVIGYHHKGNEEDNTYQGWYFVLTEEGHIIKVPSYFNERI